MVRLSALVSLAPAAVDPTLKVPVNFKVPDAPAYFPVPPEMIAFPLILTVVGAAESLAQPWAAGSNDALRVFVPSEIVPTPLIPSHWLVGAEEPLPVSWVRPKVVPVPVAVTEVAVTLESVQSIAILPVYVAFNVNDFEGLVTGGVVFLTTGFVVFQPVGHFGEVAFTILDEDPL